MAGVERNPHQSVPGTELLVDQNQSAFAHTYKHISYGNRRIILVPQPSDDPNDPLLWPRWKKWLVLGNGLFYAFNGAITGPMMAGGQSCLYFLLCPRNSINCGYRLQEWINSRLSSNYL